MHVDHDERVTGRDEEVEWGEFNSNVVPVRPCLGLQLHKQQRFIIKTHIRDIKTMVIEFSNTEKLTSITKTVCKNNNTYVEPKPSMVSESVC